jgi:hypothetical protein
MQKMHEGDAHGYCCHFETAEHACNARPQSMQQHTSARWLSALIHSQQLRGAWEARMCGFAALVQVAALKTARTQLHIKAALIVMTSMTTHVVRTCPCSSADVAQEEMRKKLEHSSVCIL